MKDFADETRIIELEMKKLFIVCYRCNEVVRLKLGETSQHA